MAKNIKKSGAGSRKNTWVGPVFLSLGFRPFFLFGPVFAVLAMANWLFLLNGDGIEPAALAPLDWHIHEMLFGYTSAAIAGFLLTAVPNWTGRYPVVGWPLLALMSVWVAGRVAMILPFGNPTLLALIEMAFLPYLAALITREIVAGRNWRNLKVLVPIIVLAGGNIWFQIASTTGGGTLGAIRLGFSAILLLIMLVGGRVTPSFTRNWLAKQEPGRMPVAFNRFDAMVLGLSAISMLAWVGFGAVRFLGPMFVLVGILHFTRLWRWAGIRCVSNPLLLVLHLFYGFVPLGFLVLSAALWFDDFALNTAALHLLGIGAIGGMTVAVSLRASMGHSGRALQSDSLLNTMMGLVAIAAIIRAVGAIWMDQGWLITASGLIFIAAFSLFAFRVGPWLLMPRLKS